MESSKKKRGKKRKRALETLLPNFDSAEGINQSALKNLYSILVKLSSNPQWKIKYVEGSHEFDLRICNEGIKLKSWDICELSDVLFDKLEVRFERLFSELTENSSSSDLFNAVEVLSLLFRCCILLLPLLALRQSLELEKGAILWKIVRKLMLPGLARDTGKHAFVFEESVYSENGCSASSVEGFSASIEFLEPCNPLLFLKCTMLEVFVDELLVHRQVTGYLKMISSAAAASDARFNPPSTQGDAGFLMEATCNHFIQSFSDKQAFGDFLSRLFCTREHPLPLPALSITAAVSLFLNPITDSAPKYMQAHLISIVSEAFHVKILKKPDRKLTNCFLSAFEKSVVFYTRHMSRLQTDGWGSTLILSDGPIHPPFESYISTETKEKINALISGLDRPSDKVLESSFSRTKSDLVGTSFRFLKDCQKAYSVSCQEEILAVLSCLVLKASESYNDKSTRPIEGATLQHLYLLASLLKLMSVSLIQAIRCVRHSNDSSHPISLKDFSSCKEYDLILNVIACFKDFDTSLPLQQELQSLMSSHATRHVDSKMMFLHFSGLLSLSFVTGIDCLVKACLLTNLALLNLFVLEEGNLDAMHLLVDSGGEYFSSEFPVVRFSETVFNQSSSLVIASKFHKMRSLHSSLMGNKHNEKESLCSETLAEEETEETCSGEIFLKCMLPGSEGLDDLVDFIECKQGKDYTSWLKNRERFRKWRSEKTAVLKWKRKKKSWKIRYGKRNS
ncbi:uncharacterized protein LOC125207336 [Salvia hispanica]|uniref:uncharacterized protein LOC125207336 n=1 Tax=Salvia hispanica TaxID=49212 RepID=UPI0020091877|nr:uncharacterized protein LOC125207336 [Salvia hispanica]